ncbi:MAG TPA: DUF4251 domain-containing protein [Bacteroidales bacterium]|nr:DUF4251 domain-containing protein [Bacteroidales bacterium]
MKRYLGIIIAIMLTWAIPSMSYSQQYFDNNTKLDKKEKKDAREAQLLANFKAIDTLLQKGAYVLEAETLNDRYGNYVPVTSTLNFIKVSSGQVVLQTGANAAIGYNGVGGVTAEGRVSNYRVSKDEKRKTFSVFFNAMTNIGTYDIYIRINADATAIATITGMTRGSLTYKGNLVAPYNSRIFKGQTTI